ARIDIAALIARAATSISPGDLDTATRELARWLTTELSPKVAGDLITRLRDLLIDRPLAPLLAGVLEVAHRNEWDRRVLAAGRRAGALDRAGFRATAGEVVDDLLARYREGMSLAPRLWIGVARLLGVIDRERFLTAFQAGLRQVVGEPDHPVRLRIADAIT